MEKNYQQIEKKLRQNSRFIEKIFSFFRIFIGSFLRLKKRTKLNCNKRYKKCRLLTAKSWNVRGASHGPALMGSCLIICQMCLSCPPSG